jgi:SAM-dependent methyltransferase
MPRSDAYQEDLAYIHDAGFGEFARASAPGLLALLRQNGVRTGRVVDLGCGSGIWARELSNAGYDAIGVDISPAMIELARRRVPEAQFHAESFLRFQLPKCQAVTALGEVFNYLFDQTNSLPALERLCRNIFHALAPRGILVFDVAEPGRCRGMKQAFKEGEGWTCLVEYQHDMPRHRLTRRIVTFRKVGRSYRRHEETHPQQLYQRAQIVRMLRSIGFRVRTVRRYGAYVFPKSVIGFVAKKP